MKAFFTSFLLLCFSLIASGQKSIDKTLKTYNKGSVPYISVKQLSQSPDAVLLDTREKEEFNISHLKDAKWVGYEYFNLDQLKETITDYATPIVVYCSIGVRSEKIGEQLQKAGYTNVKNLYGGIFEWKNKDHKVVDSLGKPTEKIHTFSKQWSKLLTKGKKIY